MSFDVKHTTPGAIVRSAQTTLFSLPQEPLAAVLHADGFHAKPNTPEGTLTRFMMKYNRETLSLTQTLYGRYPHSVYDEVQQGKAQRHQKIP